MTIITITLEDPGQPDIIDMLKCGDEHMADLYPAESNHLLSIDELKLDNVRFFVARNSDKLAIGTGAIVLHSSWAEIKRMWVEPAYRKQGLSKRILDYLQEAALNESIKTLRLETGINSKAAIDLYKSFGFQTRTPFGDYQLDPLSVFMEKSLQ